MDIILLSGRPSSGKTTTINLVYNTLAAQGAAVVVSKALLGGNPNDFECVLKYNGKQVAIYSMGDYLHTCCLAVIKYAYCDKLILAYSNKFKQNLAIEVGKCPNHRVVPKSHGNAAVNNQYDASIVVSYI